MAWKDIKHIAIDAATLDGLTTSSFVKSFYNEADNLDDILQEGIYRINENDSNLGANYGVLAVFTGNHPSGDTFAQMLFDYATGNVCIRTGSKNLYNNQIHHTSGWKMVSFFNKIPSIDTDVNTMNINDLNRGGVFRKPDLHNWRLRCHYSAERRAA